MYSDKPSILELTALLVAHGVRNAVLCAGSRSAPIVHTIASCPDIACRALVDERSAAFTAIGMALALGEPVAVVCTSGSALLDMAPAVCEAYYQKVPLVLISADRPASWIGQMDGQTMVQPGAFHNFIEREVTLPEPHDEESLWHANRLVNEALLAMRERRGPVHINVPLTEPLFRFDTPRLPQARVIRATLAASTPPHLDEELLAEWRSSRRPMLVVGQNMPGHALSGPLGSLMERGCVVVAEHLANLTGLQGRRGFVSLHEQILFGKDFAPAAEGGQDPELPYVPDLVITLGGHVVSKKLKLFLRRHRPFRHWHVASPAATPDLFMTLTRSIDSEPEHLLAQLLRCDGAPSRDDRFQELWSLREQAERRRIDHEYDAAPEPFCALTAMRRVMAALPEGCAVSLGNSSVVRNAQFFPLPAGTEVICNRGVNGIDGSLSAAVGYATCSPRRTYAFIGDLSFFYDVNGLWRDDLPANLTVVLFNNACGGIFHVLPGLRSDHLGDIAGQSSRGAADLPRSLERFGRIETVSTFEELEERLRQETPPFLLEVRSAVADDVAGYRTLI